MAQFQIEGGHPLSGEITPQGAKNETLQILCAVLMTPEEVKVENIPDIRDVNKLIEILKNLGVKVEKLSAHSYSFKADDLNRDYLKSQLFKDEGGKLRGSVMMLGSMLGRFGESSIPRPGGDKIGRRRLDTHFSGFENLGAQVDYDQKNGFFSVHAEKLRGTYMLLPEASVTGTANIVMAAVLAEGKTQIYNAACEPYLQQLCRMLVNMGAKIKGIGSNLLTIHGVEHLKGCTHRVLPDMIEIGSWIGLAALTQSSIRIKNVGWDNLGLIPATFEKLGLDISQDDDDMVIGDHSEGYEVQSFIDGSIMNISDAPWPGFNPDLLSIILVVAAQARGSVLIHQKMFESRLFFVDKLIDMGAKIILCDPHRATIIGNDFQTPLRATTMTSPDIRAGISLLIAALSAEGTSTIYNIEQIDRGYENIEERLQKLGAKIKRID